MYKEVLIELYCFLTIGESDNDPEVSAKKFATSMRPSIDKIFERHSRRLESEEFTRVATTRGELWLRRKNALQSLAQAEKELETAAKTVGSLPEKLKAGYQEISVSQVVGPWYAEKKRKFDEVDEQIEKASELCKEVKWNDS